MSDFICQKYTDCSSCSHYQKQIFKYRSYLKGMKIPKERCSQNTIFLLYLHVFSRTCELMP